MEDDYLLMFKTIAILEPEYCLIFCESLLLALLVTITNTVLVVSALVLGIVLKSHLLFGLGILLLIAAIFLCFAIFICIPLILHLYGVDVIIILIIWFHFVRLSLLVFICNQLVHFYLDKEMKYRFFQSDHRVLQGTAIMDLASIDQPTVAMTTDNSDK